MFLLLSWPKTIRATRTVADALELIRSDRRGTAAIEFVLFAGMLSLGMLNAADISIYIYKRMEVESATQMGAQAAWKTCDLNHLPAVTNCPGLIFAVQNAVQGTSLG